MMGQILLIEDDEGTQTLVRNRLMDLGHEVVVAGTGALGLLEARAGSFDLFLVDIILGSGIDGYEVCRRFKAIPQLHFTPVVLMSAQLKTREELHRGYEAGCGAYLIKGDIALLEDVVRAMLRIKSLQDDLALQNRMLADRNRRLREERQRGADLESALRETGVRSSVFRDLAAGRPEALLVIDVAGNVHHADRGAQDLFGQDVEGRTLGSLVPGSSFEAFARDARAESREGYRIELPARSGRRGRSLTASIHPMPSDKARPLMKVILLVDAGKRKAAADMLRIREKGTPRAESGVLREAAREVYHPRRIVGETESTRAFRQRVEGLAASSEAALLMGEPGVGLGFIARAIHFGGSRSGAFVPIDCSSMPVEDLASAIFGETGSEGQAEGAGRPGLIHQAEGGTLFLENADELPDELANRLADLLETGGIQPDGKGEGDSLDVRILASRALEAGAPALNGNDPMKLAHQFSVRLTVPTLAVRRGDVRALALVHLERSAPGRGLTFTEDALWTIEQYPWKGNEEELKACVEQAIMEVEGDRIGVEHLTAAIQAHHEELVSNGRLSPLPRRGNQARLRLDSDPPLSLRGEPYRRACADAPNVEEPVSLQLYERRALIRALGETDGDKLAAAKLLHIGKSTFYRKLKTHGIQ